MPREKSKYRERRSSSRSSESSYERKKSKSKHKRRSRSRDRSESSHKRKRSSSRSKYRRRSRSRSDSRDKYESKSRRRSSSRSRSKRSYKRSVSRDYSRSRSSSRSRSKHHKKSRSRRKSRSSSSRSNNSYESEKVPKVNLDDTETKLEKAIKAAEAAGLTMTKIPTYEYKEVEIKEDMPTIHDRNLLEDINSDSFVQKSFVSSKNKKSKQKVTLDFTNDEDNLPDGENKAKDDSIIDFSQLPSEEELKEMWIKKLYLYRKKLLKGEL